MLVRQCLKSCMLDFGIMQAKNFHMSKLGLEKEEEPESWSFNGLEPGGPESMIRK